MRAAFRGVSLPVRSRRTELGERRWGAINDPTQDEARWVNVSPGSMSIRRTNRVTMLAAPSASQSGGLSVAWSLDTKTQHHSAAADRSTQRAVPADSARADSNAEV